MCGLVFSKIFTKKININNIQKSLYFLRHRGPDESRIFKYKNYLFGFNRLSINNVLNGFQPFYDNETNTVVLFNGEIFNFKELISKIKKYNNIKFKFNSEAELIGKLYRLYGHKFLNYLDGQFAIVLHDVRKETTLCARDDFGIIPLFWTRDNNGIYIASEIKGFKGFPNISFKLNKKNIIRSMLQWTNIDEETSFKDIFQFMPGHCYILKNKSFTKKKYSKVNFSDKKIKYQKEEDYAEEFTEKFNKAVKKRLISDENVGYGSYLSGGVDSFIIGKTTNLYKDKFDSFSIKFQNNYYNEDRYQREAIKNLKTNNYSININDSFLRKKIKKTIYHTESPIFRSAPIPMMGLSNLAKKKGKKFILSGEGADEILLGYDIFKFPKIKKFIHKNENSNFRYLIMKNLYNHLPQYKNNKYLKLISLLYLNKNKFSKKFKCHYYRYGNNLKILSILKKKISVKNIEEYFSFTTKKNNYSDIEFAQDIEQKTLLSNYLLSSQGDRMLMANNVEGRYPFLDLDFVNFCNKIPENIKLKFLREKNILKSTYKKIIPSIISNRVKFPYQAPDINAFLNRNFVNENFKKKEIEALGMFDYDTIINLIEKYKKKNILAGYTDNISFMMVLSTILLNKMYVLNEAFNVNYIQLKNFTKNIKVKII